MNMCCQGPFYKIDFCSSYLFSSSIAKRRMEVIVWYCRLVYTQLWSNKFQFSTPIETNKPKSTNKMPSNKNSLRHRAVSELRNILIQYYYSCWQNYCDFFYVVVLELLDYDLLVGFVYFIWLS